jgi:hypothetical protein
MEGHNNQPKVGVDGVGGAFERRGDWGGTCGGVGTTNSAKKINNSNKNTLWP